MGIFKSIFGSSFDEIDFKFKMVQSWHSDEWFRYSYSRRRENME